MNIQHKLEKNMNVHRSLALFAVDNACVCILFGRHEWMTLRDCQIRRNELIMKTLELFIRLFAPSVFLLLISILFALSAEVECAVKCQWNLHNWWCVSRIERQSTSKRFSPTFHPPQRKYSFAFAVLSMMKPIYKCYFVTFLIKSHCSADVCWVNTNG